MSIQLSINKLWQRIAGGKKNDSVNLIVKRFLQAFQDHGVEASQIPRLLPQLKLDDLQSPERLLAALTPEILDQTAKLFSINTQWLEGVNDQIYENFHTCYKCPNFLLDHLAEIFDRDAQYLNFPLRILATTKKLDRNADTEQLLFPVLIEKIALVGDEFIFRYHLYRDHFDWRYPPARIELKALARIVSQRLHKTVPIYVVSRGDMKELLDGKLIPKNFFTGSPLTEPSLEDFTQPEDRTRPPREPEEIPDVERYIEDYNLQDYSFYKPNVIAVELSAPLISEPPLTAQNKPKSAGKRALAKSEIWEPIRASVKTIVELNAPESIAELIQLIKNMPHLKAKGLSDSAIRKNIASVTPEHLRGKPGRKANKSP